MGVRGLWALLDAYGQSVPPEELRGKRVAVDASVWVMQFRSAGQASGKMVEHQVLCGFLQRLLKLWYFGVEPVFVFDGVASLTKSKEQSLREVRSLELRQRYLSRQAKSIIAAQHATGLLSLRAVQENQEAKPTGSSRVGSEEDRIECSDRNPKHDSSDALKVENVTPLSDLIRSVRTRLRKREGAASRGCEQGMRTMSNNDNQHNSANSLVDKIDTSDNAILKGASFPLVSAPRKRRRSATNAGNPSICAASSIRSTSFFLTEAARYLQGRKEEEDLAAVNTLALSSGSLFMGRRTALQGDCKKRMKRKGKKGGQEEEGEKDQEVIANAMTIRDQVNGEETAQHYVVVSESRSRCSSSSSSSSGSVSPESGSALTDPKSPSTCCSEREGAITFQRASSSVELVKQDEHAGRGQQCGRSSMNEEALLLWHGGVHEVQLDNEEAPEASSSSSEEETVEAVQHRLRSPSPPPTQCGVEALPGGRGVFVISSQSPNVSPSSISASPSKGGSVIWEDVNDNENDDEEDRRCKSVDSSCWSPFDRVAHSDSPTSLLLSVREEDKATMRDQSHAESCCSSELVGNGDSVDPAEDVLHHPRWSADEKSIKGPLLGRPDNSNAIDNADCDSDIIHECEPVDGEKPCLPRQGTCLPAAAAVTEPNEKKHFSSSGSNGVVPFELLDIVQLLDYCGVPFVLSPMEADVECARLSQCGIVDAVFTEDSDVMVHGAKVVWRGFFSGSKRVVTEYRQDVLAAHGITNAVLVALATILGCDYDDGITGVGLIGALTILITSWRPHTELSSAHDILAMLSRWKHLVQDHPLPASWASDPVIGDNMTLLQFQLLRKHFTAWKQQLSCSSSFPSEHVIKFFCSTWADNTDQRKEHGPVPPHFHSRPPNWTQLRKFSHAHGLFSISPTLTHQFRLVERVLSERKESLNATQRVGNQMHSAAPIRTTSLTTLSPAGGVLHDAHAGDKDHNNNNNNNGDDPHADTPDSRTEKREPRGSGMKSVLIEMLAELQRRREKDCSVD